MAVSVEAAFVLLDKASGPLKDIQRQAILTDKALNSMGGGTSGTSKLQSFTNDLEAARGGMRDVTGEAGKAARGVKDLGREVDRTGNFFSRRLRDMKNWISGTSTLASVSRGAASGVAALGGALKGAATAFPLLITGAVLAAPAVVSLVGALGGLISSLTFAVGGGAVLGGGLMGAFGVGLGSLVAVAKPALTSLKSYQTAVQQLNTAEQSGSATAVKAAQARLDAINKANPGVKKLSDNLSGLQGAWKKATAPGRKALFGDANDAIKDLRKQMSWLGPEANKNVGAISDAFKKYVLPVLNSKAFKQFVEQLGEIFRKNLPGFAKGVVSIFKGLMNILQDVAPHLQKVGGGFAKMGDGFDKWTKSAKGKKGIDDMIDSFKQWMRLLKGVLKILGDVLGAGQKSGTKEVKGWADSVNKIADKMGKKGGTKGIQDYFEQSMKNTDKLWPVLKNVASSLADIYKVFKPLGSATQYILRNFPAPAVAALAVAFLGGKMAKGAFDASKGLSGIFSKWARSGRRGSGVAGAFSNMLSERGDSPLKPMYVLVVNEGFGGGGLSLGGKKGVATEAEELEQDATKGGWLSRLTTGGKGLLNKLSFGKLFKSGVGEDALEAGTTGAKLLEGGGLGLAVTALPMLAKLLPGGAGKAVEKVLSSKVGRGASTIGMDTATGAAIGTLIPIPGVGTGVGAATGAAVGAISALGWNPFTSKGREKFVADMGKTWGAIKDGAGKVWGGVKDVAGKAWGGIKSGAGDVAGFLKNHWEIAGALAGPIGLGVTMAIKHFGAIKNFLGGLVGDVTNLAKKIGSGFVNGIKSGVGTVTHAVGSAGSTAVHAVSSAGSSVLHFAEHPFGLAKGGRVPSTSPVLVGEAGPELLSLPGGSRVTPLTGPYAPWPKFGMQTGFPVSLPQLGAPPGGGGGIGGPFGSALGIDLSPMGINQLVNSIHQLTNALTGRNSLESALQDVGTQFDDLSQNAQNDWQTIETATKNALDNITGLLTTANDTLTKSYNTLVTSIQKSMNTGAQATQTGVNTIFQTMAKAFQTLGVSTSVSKRLSKEGFGDKGKARGGRLPGEPAGDHLPLYGRGGNLLGIADGGELVVNRHTEGRVNAKLAAYGTTLGKEVAGETRPHYANGGRIPGYATGGVVGEVNQYFSQRGWDKAAIAGLLGNAMQESSLNPSIGGGGMWQQISNFGSSSGGSLTNQMNRMYPQIVSLRARMNASTPAGAATIFEQDFERAGIPALSNRIKYAQLAYAGKLGAPLTGGTGTAPHIAAPRIGGLLPGEIAGLGQAGINLIAGAANSTLQASASRAMGGVGGAMNVPGGAGTVRDPSGKPVAAWIEPILNWARKHGWTGTVESGWRSYAEQAAIYNSGVRPAAIPGTSNHEQTKFPGGAVDVTDASTLSSVLMRGPYGSTLIWAGAKDPVHFSHPHDGHYALGGRVPWFQGGADFIASRPQLIGVGDGPGAERVTVTPQNQNATANRPVTINIGRIDVHRRGDVKKIVDEELKLLADSIGRQL